MKIVIQRVTSASVTINQKSVSSVRSGYVILLGIGKDDNEINVKKMAEKISKLRICSDENSKMNKSILDTNGEILVVSQFTLLADTTGGNRPSFIQAALPDQAKPLYELFIGELKKTGVKKVVSGEFREYMQVKLINDGPVTIVL